MPTNTPKPKTETPAKPKQDGPSCKTNSFVPGTMVLMADGSTKAIEDLQLGDQVRATDVESSAGQGRTVTNVRSHAGVKKLITFTVDVDGKDGSKTASITSTDAHLVWLPDVGMWAKAEQLKAGMWLQTAAGTWVQVTAVKRSTHQERVHNLTVNGVHTYYVLAGTTPVLVHNCGQVEYGSTDLSQAVIQERLKLGKTGNNFAAARVVGGDGVERIEVAFSSKGLGNHAEQKLMKKFGGQIKEMYSEFPALHGHEQVSSRPSLRGYPDVLLLELDDVRRRCCGTCFKEEGRRPGFLRRAVGELAQAVAMSLGSS
ncbi:polymorphic toxin-type HINT domain-containing protein [Micromonospora sp. DT31]|uniref:polymorphic toxin-type HINT domain-containing protein n=1 Tax=Micromonospora sp. DT31 TaxID=3393434 RepID=UPI003CF2C816